MRALELVHLGNGELLVNVTKEHDLAEVREQLAQDWTWESEQGPVVHPPAEEEEYPTEWLVLIGAQPKAAPAAA